MTHVTREGKISSLATSITVRFHPCQPPLHDAPPPHHSITDNGAGGGGVDKHLRAVHLDEFRGNSHHNGGDNRSTQQ